MSADRVNPSATPSWLSSNAVTDFMRVSTLSTDGGSPVKRATGPVIQRLREQMGGISRNELDALFRRNPDLSEQQQAAIEKTVHRIVNKLLHPPLESLKDEARAGTPHGLLDAVKRLFNLSD